MKQRKHSSTPRRKRMNRAGRLSSARATTWTTTYEGKNIVKGYSKWFGVSLLTAIIELRMLGVEIDAAREAQIRATEASRSEEKRRRREASAGNSPEALDPDSDGTFAYIAGYTSGRASHGVTWEELAEAPLWDAGQELPF